MPRSAVAVLVLAVTCPSYADIVFENPRVRAVLGTHGAWRALVDKATGTDYAFKGKRIPLADVGVGTGRCSANRAAMAGDQLTVGFAGCDTQLVYAVTTAPDWITFRLVRVAGTRPSHVTMVRLGVTITKNVGSRLTCGWDERFAVCLRGANPQTLGSARRRGAYAELIAATQDAPGPKLEGAAAALVAAPTPELRGILHRLSVAYGLARNTKDGVPTKDLPLARQSYWFMGFGEKDVDKVIDCCTRMGFRQVMMGSSSWCANVGHYTFRTNRYPDGIESLRRTVAKLHKHGILVGMHCFASKISKRDAYVAPIPDRRFWVDMTASLAADIGPADTAVRTASDLSQWPGSPVCKKKRWEGGVGKHQEVIIDNEIIRYETIGPEGKWNTFLGCSRGSWKTQAAAHKAGTECRHYGVDGCINGYIIDQETSLLDEAQSRLAHVFNTCDFDMVYFDGGEDVDRRRFSYYSSKFQANAMAKFRKRPLIHMGTCFSHNLWHTFTRSGTVDTYLNTLHGAIISGATIDKWPTVRDHIDRSVRYMLRVRQDMIPGELGWFGIWPKRKHTDGLQLDEAEYLMAKSLAYDAPISLQTGFAQMEAHPLTPGILDIVKAYEAVRMAGIAPAATRARLEPKGRDFVLFRASPRQTLPEFVEVTAVPTVGGTHDVRAFVGTRGADAVATVWHYTAREGKLVLDIAPAKARATDVFGSALELGAVGGKLVVPLSNRRTTLLLKSTTADAARSLLANGMLEVRKPVTLWIQAEEPRRIVGKMAKGSEAGVAEPGAFGDVVVCTGRPDRNKPKEWYCEYRVDIPSDRVWTLWARVRYLSGTDESFAIVRPGEEVTLDYSQVLGNCGRNEAKWHWTGRGGGSAVAPPGVRIAFKLRRGTFTFRIYAREGGGTAAVNPRLDLLCLTDDTSYVPTDPDAKAALAARGRQ